MSEMNKEQEVFLKDAGRIIDKYSNDEEVMHRNLDALMEKELVNLGYKEAIQLIRKQIRWYA